MLLAEIEKNVYRRYDGQDLLLFQYDNPKKYMSINENDVTLQRMDVFY